MSVEQALRPPWLRVAEAAVSSTALTLPRVAVPGAGTMRLLRIPLVMTTVLLVDDHPLVLAGLTALVATTDDLQVVGGASGGEEAIVLAATLQPDIILMDLSMPGMDRSGNSPDPGLVTGHADGRAHLVRRPRSSRRCPGRRRRRLSAEDGDPREVLAASAQPRSACTHRPSRRACSPAVTRAATPETLSDREVQVLRLVSRGWPTGRSVALWHQREHRQGPCRQRLPPHRVTDRTSAAMWPATTSERRYRADRSMARRAAPRRSPLAQWPRRPRQDNNGGHADDARRERRKEGGRRRLRATRER